MAAPIPPSANELIDNIRSSMKPLLERCAAVSSFCTQPTDRKLLSETLFNVQDLLGQLTSTIRNLVNVNQVTQSVSFSDIVKAQSYTINRSQSKQTKATANFTALISDPDEKLDHDQLLSTVKDCIDPGQLGVAVSSVRPSYKGILVSCPNEKDINIVTKCLQEQQAIKLNCEILAKKRPWIMFRNVADSVKHEDLFYLAIAQNSAFREALETYNINENNITDKFTFKFNRNAKAPDRKTFIYELDPVLWNICIRFEKLFLSWSPFYISDFVPGRQCFRCLRFGHFSKQCTADETCSFCGGNHIFKVCKAKLIPNAKPSCNNCSTHNSKISKQTFKPRDGKQLTHNVNHNALDPACPLLKIHISHIKSQIDYGTL